MDFIATLQELRISILSEEAPSDTEIAYFLIQEEETAAKIAVFEILFLSSYTSVIISSKSVHVSTGGLAVYLRLSAGLV